MTHADPATEPEEISEDIVDWQPERGPLVGHWDGHVVAVATVGALALLGFTAGAYLAGRRQGLKSSSGYNLVH